MVWKRLWVQGSWQFMESKGHRENGPYDTKSWTVRRGLDGLGSGVYDAGSRVYHSVGLLNVWVHIWVPLFMETTWS